MHILFQISNSLPKEKALESAGQFLASPSTEVLLVKLGENGQIEKYEYIKDN